MLQVLQKHWRYFPYGIPQWESCCVWSVHIQRYRQCYELFTPIYTHTTCVVLCGFCTLYWRILAPKKMCLYFERDSCWRDGITSTLSCVPIHCWCISRSTVMFHGNTQDIHKVSSFFLSALGRLFLSIKVTTEFSCLKPRHHCLRLPLSRHEAAREN